MTIAPLDWFIGNKPGGRKWKGGGHYGYYLSTLASFIFCIVWTAGWFFPFRLPVITYLCNPWVSFWDSSWTADRYHVIARSFVDRNRLTRRLEKQEATEQKIKWRIGREKWRYGKDWKRCIKFVPLFKRLHDKNIAHNLHQSEKKSCVQEITCSGMVKPPTKGVGDLPAQCANGTKVWPAKTVRGMKEGRRNESQPPWYRLSFRHVLAENRGKVQELHALAGLNRSLHCLETYRKQTTSNESDYFRCKLQAGLVT